MTESDKLKIAVQALRDIADVRAWYHRTLPDQWPPFDIASEWTLTKIAKAALHDMSEPLTSDAPGEELMPTMGWILIAWFTVALTMGLAWSLVMGGLRHSHHQRLRARVVRILAARRDEEEHRHGL